MTNFRIIPVLDIMNSIAVHAKKGNRDLYLPLKSNLFNTVKPFEIIECLSKVYNFDEIYIADLDKIINNQPNLDLLKKIEKLENIRILIDPGISNINDLELYSNFKIHKLILGLETLNKISLIEKANSFFGADKIILSIDMFQGRLISKINNLSNKDPLIFLSYLQELNVKEIILLDLYRVGQKMGGIPKLYKKIQNSFPGKVIIGGGIRNYHDLMKIKDNKFSGVLIATALHDGTINIENLKTL
ncbi:MAG: hypothetical protein GF353_26715 [Candidatus Lokiarchaeota archaeon]|nr:hypothetical protein [Candidatus Lokiarchaeota archaeon]